MRGAFVYGWYPEQWEQAGHRFTPMLGLYDSGMPSVIDAQIVQMQGAQIETGLWSWWGKDSPTDKRFRLALDRAELRGFSFAVYYELDWNGQASSWRIRRDLSYLRSKYFSHPAYLHIGGRPVLFVYSPGGSQSSMEKWIRARRDYNLYISPTDYPQWWEHIVDGRLPFDSYHGYHPEQRGYAVRLGSRIYSVSISAGFWSAASPEPVLPRATQEEWALCANILTNSGADWELLYWNEYGEGSQIEPSDASCNEWYCLDYIIPLS